FIYQRATGSLVSLANSGTMAVVASASALGDESAAAFALADGVDQLVFGTTGTMIYTNSGVVSANANAFASADSAVAEALVGAVDQFGFAAANSVVIENSGTVEVNGTANAVGTSFASAEVRAAAFEQYLFGGAGDVASFNNSGSLSVSAIANAQAPAVGGVANAEAEAFGLIADGNVPLDITNSGLM